MLKKRREEGPCLTTNEYVLVVLLLPFPVGFSSQAEGGNREKDRELGERDLLKIEREEGSCLTINEYVLLLFLPFPVGFSSQIEGGKSRGRKRAK